MFAHHVVTACLQFGRDAPQQFVLDIGDHNLVRRRDECADDPEANSLRASGDKRASSVSRDLSVQGLSLPLAHSMISLNAR
jgi:hypothetical protein